MQEDSIQFPPSETMRFLEGDFYGGWYGDDSFNTDYGGVGRGAGDGRSRGLGLGLGVFVAVAVAVAVGVAVGVGDTVGVGVGVGPPLGDTRTK